ncbi:matrixin family metalloprotease [Colwellia hornerae]|uniref:Matrixin family metalloprotease n=1 Tax=Colwellia hornerae TaxID=89402 RepID=A0A5C6QB18_9GAMM|nr:matrixin family metalloprotease [Colwellia hornerae]TWX59566.1 matrixin family metalloprotease [Colwellia hornerae]TWX62936.1 matrixin family metalloprotease [Colwellia hornerae]TWX65830.1 matrixin family metalloprotease [Colwellia hornerae]
MNLSLNFISRFKIRKILMIVNLCVMLTFTNTVNANIILVGNGWDGPGQGAVDVKYYFGTMTTDNSLLAGNIHSAFLVAFDAWSNATNNNLTFTETLFSGENNSIDISFVNKVHGDNSNFGSRVLAHAFYPDDRNPAIIAGDLHMNDEGFSWEIGDSLGSAAFDITRIAVHEIGHSIGIGHTQSGFSGNIMDPTISSRGLFSGLSAGDIDAACSLYLCDSVKVSEPATLVLILLGAFWTMISTRRKVRK